MGYDSAKILEITGSLPSELCDTSVYFQCEIGRHLRTRPCYEIRKMVIMRRLECFCPCYSSTIHTSQKNRNQSSGQDCWLKVVKGDQHTWHWTVWAFGSVIFEFEWIFFSYFWFDFEVLTSQRRCMHAPVRVITDVFFSRSCKQQVVIFLRSTDRKHLSCCFEFDQP